MTGVQTCALPIFIEQAQRRPLGDSWTYATPKECAQSLAESLINDLADFVFQSEELTVGQGYMLRRKIYQHYGIKE